MNSCNVDLHCHTTCSDGSHTPVQTLEKAKERNMIFGITDHNVVSAIQQLLSSSAANPQMRLDMQQHIIPGIEVQSAEAAELLIYGTSADHIIDFYTEVLADRLDTQDPIFSPIDISIIELIQQCRAWEMEIIIPHFSLRNYGLGRLPTSLQKEAKAALRSYHGHVCVERNPHVHPLQNLQAIAFAKGRKNKFPLVASSDDHTGEHSSYTTIRHVQKAEQGYQTSAVFSQIHKKKVRWRDQHLQHGHMLQQLRQRARIAWNMGAKGLRSILQQELRNMGLSTAKRPVKKRKTVDVGDVADS